MVGTTRLRRRLASADASAALIVWFAPGYRSGDQVNAATLLIGFKMFLFLIALIGAFIALAVHEGRRTDDGRS